MNNTIINQIYSTAVDVASYTAEEISQIDRETAVRICAIAVPALAGLLVLACAVKLLYQYKFKTQNHLSKEHYIVNDSYTKEQISLKKKKLDKKNH